MANGLFFLFFISSSQVNEFDNDSYVYSRVYLGREIIWG